MGVHVNPLVKNPQKKTPIPLRYEDLRDYCLNLMTLLKIKEIAPILLQKKTGPEGPVYC